MSPDPSTRADASGLLNERLSANPGYAADQMLRAFRALTGDPNQRAGQRAATWWSVLHGMMTGSVRIGSRAPIPDIPTWATPQVVTGGFATGRLMARGKSVKYRLFSIKHSIGV